EFFIVQRERDQLLREKMSVLHNMMITDRVVSLGVLASGLGHHIRNSLVAVRTFLDLAPAKLKEENVDLEELRNPNFWQDFYHHVQAQVARITDMLSDLGAATERASTPFQDQLQIETVMNQALEPLRGRFAEKQITVETRVPANLPCLIVDGQKFSRLFEMLFEDELENLPAGSKVSLDCRLVSSEKQPDAQIELTLRDNGPGLPEEALRSVFDPFFLRHNNPQEFGLRLMTCFFIVYHHGGRIAVQSQPGDGLTFVITLPLQPPPASPREEDARFVTNVLLNETLWEKLLAGP
ncbi:MAG: ATP-binding protein, partial [Verrucomicrobiota bacterium]